MVKMEKSATAHVHRPTNLLQWHQCRVPVQRLSEWLGKFTIARYSEIMEKASIAPSPWMGDYKFVGRSFSIAFHLVLQLFSLCLRFVAIGIFTLVHQAIVLCCAYPIRIGGDSSNEHGQIIDITKHRCVLQWQKVANYFAHPFKKKKTCNTFAHKNPICVRYTVFFFFLALSIFGVYLVNPCSQSIALASVLHCIMGIGECGN